MVNFILTLTIFGILGFLAYTFGGGEYIAGLTAKKDNHTKVITEPMFQGKTILANLVLMNENEFAIKAPSLTCVVAGRSGQNLKTITKELPDMTIEAGGQQKLSNYNITIVSDFPSKLECHISKFRQ